MTLNQITRAIEHGTLTNQDLNRVIEAVKYARRQQQRTAMREITVGDNVTFESTKLHKQLTGVVVKTAIKYVTVRTLLNGVWRVPANMLTKVEEETA